MTYPPVVGDDPIVAVGYRPISCVGALSRFDDYVAAVTEGLDIREVLPEVAAHLDFCPFCTRDFAALMGRLRDLKSRA